MPLTDGTCRSKLPDKSNPPSNTSKEEEGKLHSALSLKMRVNLRFYSCFFGYKKDSEPVRADIIEYMEGRLKPERHVDERNLTSVAVLEKIHGGKIIDCKRVTDEDSKSDYCIELGESIKKRFSERCVHDGFRTISAAVRGLVYSRIMEWKQKYETKEKTKTDNDVIAPDSEDEKELKQLLGLLKHDFPEGSDLDLIINPKAESDNDGEVKGKKIFVYSETYEGAIDTVIHEYNEKGTSDVYAQPFVDAINLKQILDNLYWKTVMDYFNNGEGYDRRERFNKKIVEKLKTAYAISLSKSSVKA
jgi:hypothetical protein